MIYLEFPKLVAFGTWCTCKELAAEISLQARHFMAYYTSTGKILSTQTTNVSPRKDSKQPLSLAKVQGLPFKIILIDTSTNQCAICSSKNFEGKTERLCPGCPLPNEDTPIRKLVNYFGNLSVCLDWTDMQQYGVQEEMEDPSIKFVTTQLNPSLQDCLKLHFTPVMWDERSRKWLRSIDANVVEIRGVRKWLLLLLTLPIYWLYAFHLTCRFS